MSPLPGRPDRATSTTSTCACDARWSPPRTATTARGDRRIATGRTTRRRSPPGRLFVFIGATPQHRLARRRRRARRARLHPLRAPRCDARRTAPPLAAGARPATSGDERAGRLRRGRRPRPVDQARRVGGGRGLDGGAARPPVPRRYAWRDATTCASVTLLDERSPTTSCRGARRRRMRERRLERGRRTCSGEGEPRDALRRARRGRARVGRRVGGEEVRDDQPPRAGRLTSAAIALLTEHALPRADRGPSRRACCSSSTRDDFRQLLSRTPDRCASSLRGVRAGAAGASRRSSASARSSPRSAPLAAGLAHELNNPAAAARRARRQLTLRELERAAQARRSPSRAGAATLGSAARRSRGARRPRTRARRPARPVAGGRPRGRVTDCSTTRRRRGLASSRRPLVGGAARRGLDRPRRASAASDGAWPRRCATWRRSPTARGAARRAGRGDPPHLRARRRGQELHVHGPGAPPGRRRPRGPREHARRARPQAAGRSRGRARVRPPPAARSTAIRRRAQPGLDEPDRQRDRRGRRHGTDHRCAPRGDGDQVVVEIADDGPGIPARARGAHLRAVLHHQGGRPGHGPRPRHRPAHRPAPPRRADRRVTTRGHPLPRRPAGR